MGKLFFSIGAFGVVFILAMVVWGDTTPGDHSRFYGLFDRTLSGEEPRAWTEKRRLRIGSDESRMGEEDYLHIPWQGTPVTNAWTKEDGGPAEQVITISGSTIMIDERMECVDDQGVRSVCWTRELEFAFSRDYEEAAISGIIWSDDREANQGRVTGSLTRMEESGGGGGGCFADTAQGLRGAM